MARIYLWLVGFLFVQIKQLQLKWSIWALLDHGGQHDKNLADVHFPQQMLNINPCDPKTWMFSEMPAFPCYHQT